MTWVEFRRVVPGWLLITDDIRARTKEPRVAELAASMREATGGEPGQPPVVRMKGEKYEIISGRDRVAAVMVLGSADLWVRVAKCSDREALLWEVHENLHRRPEDKAALLARLVDETERDSRRVSGNADAKDSRQPGRPTTPRGDARRQVARETGLSVDAVERADQRVRAREEGAATATAGSGRSRDTQDQPPPPIETWGLACSEVFLDDVRAIQAAVDAADRHLQAAQAAWSKAPDGALRDSWRSELHRVAANIRGDRPVSLCPWCKHGFPGFPLAWRDGLPVPFGTDCLGCRGKGWITAETLANAPRELLSADVYAVAGEFLSYAEAAKKYEQMSTGVPIRPAPSPVAARSPADAAATPSAKTSAPISRRVLVDLPGGRMDIGGVPDEELPRATNPTPASKLLTGPDGEEVDPYAGDAPPFDDSDVPELEVERDDEDTWVE